MYIIDQPGLNESATQERFLSEISVRSQQDAASFQPFRRSMRTHRSLREDVRTAEGNEPIGEGKVKAQEQTFHFYLNAASCSICSMSAGLEV